MSYEDRVLLRLRRQYSKDEAVALISEKLKQAELEIGYLKSEKEEIGYLLNKKKNKVNSLKKKNKKLKESLEKSHQEKQDILDGTRLSKYLSTIDAIRNKMHFWRDKYFDAKARLSKLK